MDDSNIGKCVEAIRANADESDPVRSPDSTAFIYVFAVVLIGLVPADVVLRRKDEIDEVMGELAGIVEEVDGLSWTTSYRRCVEQICFHFWFLSLEDTNLRPKLRRLGATWNSRQCR